MNKNWLDIRLGDVLRLKHGYAFKGKYFSQSGEYIVLTPGNFLPQGGLQLKGNKEKYYSTNDFPKEYILKRGDLLFVMTDLTQTAAILGAPAFVDKDNIYLHNQRLGLVENFDVDKVDKWFLYYIMNSYNVRGQIKGSATGATVKHTSPDRIYDVRISIPKLPVQQKIASILSAYDNLIENNTKRIQILEEMAQRIYKEWFVDFKYPGHENDELVDSDLGMIPEGWDINNIGDFIQYHIGGGWGKEELSEEFDTSGYVIRGTDIPLAKYGSIIKCPYRYHKSSNMKSRELKTGDIVFEVSGGSKDQPLGRALLINKELLNSFSDKVMCASFCKLIRPSNFSEYIYLHLLDIYRNREIMKYQVQSTGISNFKFQTFHDGHKIIKPTRNILDQFTELVSPIFSQMQILGKNNNNLRQTRDLLLPKLISGKIDVSDLDIDTSILYD